MSYNVCFFYWWVKRLQVFKNVKIKELTYPIQKTDDLDATKTHGSFFRNIFQHHTFFINFSYSRLWKSAVYVIPVIFE